LYGFQVHQRACQMDKDSQTLRTEYLYGQQVIPLTAAQNLYHLCGLEYESYLLSTKKVKKINNVSILYIIL